MRRRPDLVANAACSAVAATGAAKITRGCRPLARHVIHTVGRYGGRQRRG
jgi:O-acetyl-ADP-ribose deacetylase (regulator of RNase III)